VRRARIRALSYRRQSVIPIACDPRTTLCCGRCCANRPTTRQSG
jgi:hypothetical protein